MGVLTDIQLKITSQAVNWMSIPEIARATSLSKGQVSYCIRRLRGKFDKRYEMGEWQYRLVSCREKENPRPPGDTQP